MNSILGYGGKNKNIVEEENFGEIFEAINYNTEQINEREYAVSKIDEKVWEKYQTKTLGEILFSDAKTDLGCLPNVYKTKFFIAGFQPLNLMEVCQLFCDNCMSTFSYKEFQQVKGVPACSKCEQMGRTNYLEPIFKIQFWIKDKSTLN